MGEGAFVLACCGAIPVIMTVIGVMLWRGTPGRNHLVGWRTRRAAASEAAWNYANQRGGLLTVRLGLLFFLLFLLYMLVVAFAPRSAFGGMVVFASVFFVFGPVSTLLLTILQVEGELKSRFGRR